MSLRQRESFPTWNSPALAVVLAALLGVGSFLWTQPSFAKARKGGAHHTVVIKGLKYEPDMLTVKPGDTVEWVNEDMLPHTATAVGKEFDSGPIQSKQHFRWTAKEKGTFAYGCTFHPTMKATLIVR